MNLSFTGAYIVNSIPLYEKSGYLPPFEKQGKLRNEAENKGKNLVDEKKAECYTSYLHFDRTREQIHAVLLTDDDAKPLLQLDNFDSMEAQHYGEGYDNLSQEKLHECETYKMNIAEHSGDLWRTLKDYGFFKAITRGDKLD